jgi:deoxyribodipyrimidine photo-lyase
MKQFNKVVFWFRRDLRLEDNAGLYHALKNAHEVIPIFIFDTDILSKLQDKKDKRVQFIYQSIQALQSELQKLGSDLHVYYGKPIQVLQNLHKNHAFEALYANRDYEPLARKRDKEVYEYFAEQSIDFKAFKDQVIFEKDEVLSDSKKFYSVFTPYKNKWRATLNDFYIKPYPNHKYFASFSKTKAEILIPYHELGFEWESDFIAPDKSYFLKILSKYAQLRNFPSLKATSRISVHLRFGTISIRYLVKEALTQSDTWVNELIWRDFYFQILWHRPDTQEKSFKPAYDAIEWRSDASEFEQWCQGKTGYPIVDAGMRELNATGFMHNRVRMIVASFLVKHLLIDWRWGEAYFAQKLLDYDASANIGGWQWAAGSGCDAAPYFRIFNPYEQTKKFDPEMIYIKQWIPELDSPQYPAPIVEHTLARNRCLEVYKKGLNNNL